MKRQQLISKIHKKQYTRCQVLVLQAVYRTELAQSALCHHGNSDTHLRVLHRHSYGVFIKANYT